HLQVMQGVAVMQRLVGFEQCIDRVGRLRLHEKQPLFFLHCRRPRRPQMIAPSIFQSFGSDFAGSALIFSSCSTETSATSSLYFGPSRSRPKSIGSIFAASPVNRSLTSSSRISSAGDPACKNHTCSIPPSAPMWRFATHSAISSRLLPCFGLLGSLIFLRILVAKSASSRKSNHSSWVIAFA